MAEHKKQEGLKKSFVYTMQCKIISGELQIGQQLPPERELAAQMGVSRSLVNTGILELEEQGFVRVSPRQGSIVADYKKNGTLQVLIALMNCDTPVLDYPLFCNMVDLRVLVECECARLASVHARSTDIDRLSLWLDEIGRAEDPLDAVVGRDVTALGEEFFPVGEARDEVVVVPALVGRGRLPGHPDPFGRVSFGFQPIGKVVAVVGAPVQPAEVCLRLDVLLQPHEPLLYQAVSARSCWSLFTALRYRLLAVPTPMPRRWAMFSSDSSS